MVEGGCHPEKDHSEQMDKDVEDLLDIGNEFKDRQSSPSVLLTVFSLLDARASNFFSMGYLPGAK